MTQTSAILNPAATSPEASIAASTVNGYNRDHTSTQNNSLAKQEANDTDFAALVQNTIDKSAATNSFLRYKVANTSDSAQTTLLSDGAENILFLLLHGGNSEHINPTDVNSEELLSSLDTSSDGQLSSDVLATLLNSIEAGSLSESALQITDTQAPDESQSDIASLLSFIIQQSDDEGANNASLAERIQNLLNSDNQADILLTNLTPSERTELLSALEQHINNLSADGEIDNEAVIEALYAQYIILSQPTQKVASEGTPAIQNAAETTRVSATTAPPAHEQLRAPLQNTGEPNPLLDAATSDTSSTQNSDEDLPSLDSFQKTLDQIAGKANENSAQNTNRSDTPNAQQPTQPASVMTQDTQSLLSTNSAIPTMESVVSQNTPLQSSLTQNITQSQSAVHAHPATQLVSATIQKAAKAGEDTNIRLTLNPAELGRVEVKMSIDQDNISKIVLTAEKPETFMMLRRDADMLERALVDSGLDAKSDLSFEMAKDDSQFNHSSNDDNRSQNMNVTENHSDAEEVIETIMNWFTDPNTGHMHYNIVI